MSIVSAQVPYRRLSEAEKRNHQAQLLELVHTLAVNNVLFEIAQNKSFKKELGAKCIPYILTPEYILENHSTPTEIGHRQKAGDFLTKKGVHNTTKTPTVISIDEVPMVTRKPTDGDDLTNVEHQAKTETVVQRQLIGNQSYERRYGESGDLFSDFPTSDFQSTSEKQPSPPRSLNGTRSDTGKAGPIDLITKREPNHDCSCVLHSITCTQPDNLRRVADKFSGSGSLCCSSHSISGQYTHHDRPAVERTGFMGRNPYMFQTRNPEGIEYGRFLEANHKTPSAADRIDSHFNEPKNCSIPNQYDLTGQVSNPSYYPLPTSSASDPLYGAFCNSMTLSNMPHRRAM